MNRVKMRTLVSQVSVTTPEGIEVAVTVKQLQYCERCYNDAGEARDNWDEWITVEEVQEDDVYEPREVVTAADLGMPE